MKEIIFSKMPLKSIMRVSNIGNFHSVLVKFSIGSLLTNYKETKIESVLALGASHVEAENLIKFPFKKIVLSGISPADEKIKRIINKDNRVRYVNQNIEKISFKAKSFDLVFVKEAIHHVPRPILALYEMLRVAKKAVIFIEPAETMIGNILEKMGLTSKYETNQKGNIRFRDNYVYRWRMKEVIKLLNSYYLESDYKVNFTSCWMSNRLNNNLPLLVRPINFFGWFASFFPFSRGNFLICTIIPGWNLPYEIE